MTFAIKIEKFPDSLHGRFNKNTFNIFFQNLEAAMKTMILEKITATMDKFEASFDKLDLTTATMEGAMGSAMATSAPTSAVDALIRQVRLN